MSKIGWMLAALVVLGVVVMWVRQRATSTVDAATAHRLVQQGATLLDVRSQQEFASGHAAGAMNVPVQELRNRIDEVPKDRPVVVYCQSGMRSAAATAVLRASGRDAHDVATLDRYTSAKP